MEPNSTLPINSEGIVVTKERKYKKYILLAIPILLIALAGMVLFGYFKSKQISEGLMGVYITDIKDQSAVVSWVTSDPSKTELLYSTEELNFFSQFSGALVGYDRRELVEVGDGEYELEKRDKYYVHSVTLRDLDPDTSYYFSIKNNVFLSDATYVNTFTTSSLIEEMSTPDIAYGSIFNQDGEIINDTLVIVQVVNSEGTYKSQPFSYVMDGNRGWTVDVSNLLDDSLSQKYIKSEGDYLSIRVVNSKDDIEERVDLGYIKPVKNISAYDNEYVFSEGDGENVLGVTACLNGEVEQEVFGSDGCTSDCRNGTWVYRECVEVVRNCIGESKYVNSSDQVCFRECNFANGTWKSAFTCLNRTAAVEEEEDDPVEEEEVVVEEEIPEDGVSGLNKVECQTEGYYWCSCLTGGTPRCFTAPTLRDYYESSCPNYCAASMTPAGGGGEESTGKTQYCGSGDLADCDFGCEERGPTEDDRCRPAPTINQEIRCDTLITREDCEDTMGICNWSNYKCVRSASAGYTRCADITTQVSCNATYGCEYVGGRCIQQSVQESAGEGENIVYGYQNLDTNNAEICTDTWMSSGDCAVVTQGTNLTPETSDGHVSASSCAVDLSVPSGTPMWHGQIAGYSIPEGSVSVEWEENYSCVSGEDSGFGCYIDVTEPNGQVVRYAHLECTPNFSNNGCDSAIRSGNSGHSLDDGHLHIEVRADSVEEAGRCSGEYNPCLYIQGGCYYCNEHTSAVSLEGGEETAYIPSFDISLVKKVNAQEGDVLSAEDGLEEEWPDATLFVEDLNLEEGLYTFSSSSSTRTRNFIKTDDNHIVFFADDDGDGLLGEDEAILAPSAVEAEYNVTYSKVADSYKLVLVEGLNLVAFPIAFINSEDIEVKTASELIKYLNDGGAMITTIAAYRDGIFLSYVEREGSIYGEDFNILPGEGYFVISEAEGVYLYSGFKVENGLEVALYPGWNLVNIYNSTKESYSAFDVLDQMQAEAITATTLSKWEDGKYTGVVDENELQYGYDFNVYPTRGYFIRVTDGEGRFIPE